MKNRIFKNWKSTITGLVLLIFAGALTAMKVISWQSFVAFIPTCMGFMYVKDSIWEPNVE